MSAANELKVLKSSRFWMNCIGLCVESENCTFGRIKIPVWLVRLIYSIPMSTLILLAVCHVIESNFDLIVSSISIFVIVGAGQVQMIYLSLIAKNAVLIDLLNRLQKLIDKSECSRVQIMLIKCGIYLNCCNENLSKSRINQGAIALRRSRSKSRVAGSTNAKIIHFC